MSIEPNAAYTKENAAFIKLAGREWPIPQLAIIQNRIVVPGLMALKNLSPTKITTEEFDALTSVVFAALKRAHNGLTREQFDNMAIDPGDLFSALPVIGKQSGLIKEAAAPGEA